MTDIARIGNIQRVAHGGADEAKGVAADVHVAQRLGNFRHVASDALAASTARQMMGVRRDGRSMRSIRRIRAMTVQA